MLAGRLEIFPGTSAVFKGNLEAVLGKENADGYTVLFNGVSGTGRDN